jgi:hypothetical protein
VKPVVSDAEERDGLYEWQPARLEFAGWMLKVQAIVGSEGLVLLRGSENGSSREGASLEAGSDGERGAKCSASTWVIDWARVKLVNNGAATTFIKKIKGRDCRREYNQAVKQFLGSIVKVHRYKMYLVYGSCVVELVVPALSLQGR